jgi:hypothetical protein
VADQALAERVSTPPPGLPQANAPAARLDSAPVARLAAVGRRLERVRGHALPVLALVFVDLIVMRNVVFGHGVPTGADSAFLYSDLRLYAAHHVLAFTAWAPEPFGQAQQYSIYWFLAMFTTLTGSVIGVYKLAMVTTLLLASVGSYCLAFWLSRTRLGAGSAAALYVLVPFSIAQWTAGHLNVQISYALGPWMVWSLWVSLRSGTRTAMVTLGLAGSASYLLTTGQGLYWLLPLSAVVAGEAFRQRREVRRFLIRLGLTLGIGGGAFVIGSAVELIPFAAGVSAPFVSGGSRLYIQGLAIHAKYSESLFHTIIGIPTEDWTTHNLAGAPYHGTAYQACAIGLLLFAGSALLTKSRRIAAVLALPTIVAWFLGAGPFGAAGPLYRLLYYHVPYFSLLRVPNRWLMVSTLGISMLVAVTLGRLRSNERAGQGCFGAERPSLIAALWVVPLAAFFGTYALVSGLQTTEPPAAFVKAYGTLAADRQDVRVLTTPFWQAWMQPFGEANPVTSIEPDLGAVSRYWNGHPVVFRGGWDLRASRFVTYLYGLVGEGATRSITKLAGAAGVKYIGIDPQSALEVVDGQNAFFRRQEGLTLTAAVGPVSIYRNQYALPQAFTTPTTCIVAGGMHVLGDLADQPWFSFAHTGIEFADQLAAVQGPGALASRLSAKDACVVVAPGGARELAVLLHTVDRVPLSRFAPASLSQTPTDPGTDVGAEPMSNVELLPGQQLVATLRAPRPGTYSVWLSALEAAARGEIQISLDGQRLGTLNLANDGSGTVWTRFRRMPLREGTHRVVIENVSPRAGGATEVSQLALMPANVLGWTSTPSAANGVVDEEGGVGPLSAPRQVGKRLTRAAWKLQQGNGGSVVGTPIGGGLELTVRSPARRYYTLARLLLNRGIDPNRPFVLHFRGTGSGRKYYLVAAFDAEGQRTAVFRFTDTARGTRTILFSPLEPTKTNSVPDWSHVVSFAFSTASKDVLRPGIAVDGPFASGIDTKPKFIFRGRRHPLIGSQTVTSALFPRDQAIGTSAQLTRKTGPGLLVLSQSYDPSWRLHAATGSARHVIALGFANGYELARPVANASVSFDAAKWGEIGTLVSLVAWLTGIAIAIAAAARTRAARRVSRQLPAPKALSSG